MYDRVHWLCLSVATAGNASHFTLYYLFFVPICNLRRLVDDVFGKDNQGKVPIEKVMMLIWQFRDDPSVVQFMAQFVAKYAGSRDVFDGVEFYLPQLAHMIIHLEASWDDAILERFALIIAQQSLHFALQFNWILQGAIEDYQPETAEGLPNPAYNPLFYSRCVKLLGNIERCVVYGKPRSHELQRLYEMGKISKQEYELMEQADRRFIAAQIVATGTGKNASSHKSSDGQADDDDDGRAAFGGNLMYKRRVRSAAYKPKPWKTRYFEISDRMLYCYNTKGGKLVRAMPLAGAEVDTKEMGKEGTKYRHMFTVRNQHFAFTVRATSADERDTWVSNLKDESAPNALYPHHLPTVKGPASGAGGLRGGGGAKKIADGRPDDKADESKQFMKDLSPSQRARYDFFKGERDFVRALCDIAENLRFKDRADRKKLAPGMVEKMAIPDCSYIPLVGSTDIWQRIHSSIPKDTRVFNTNERCPIIMHFITKRGEQIGLHRGGLRDVNLDVAEYLHVQYEVPDSELRAMNGMTSIGEGAEGEEEDDGAQDVGGGDFEPAPDAPEVRTSSSSHELVWKNYSSISPNASDKPSGENFGSNDDDDGEDINASNHNGARGATSGNRETILQKGNKQVQKLFREDLVKMPSKLVNRIQTRRRVSQMSYLDKATGPLQMVPIVEEGDDVSVASMSSVGTAGTGSILTKEGVVVSVEPEDDGIDKASIGRAKAIVCSGESWADKSARMLGDAVTRDSDDSAACSEVIGVMAKSNDDLRQEVFVMQMIHYYKSVFAKASLPIWLKTYRILSTSKDTGLIEVLTDSTSIDGLKKSDGFPPDGNLRTYFEKVYGPPDSHSFKAAQRNFMLSLVGYSLVCYFLGLNDRHNGNIMIDLRGHLVHIDFGFAFGMAPGHEFSMEKAPFKLTKDYMDVMEGPDSECFKEFQRLFVAGFEAARANSQIALGLVEIMMFKSNYPCFTGARYGHGVSLKRFEERLMLSKKDSKIRQCALRLIKDSIEHTGTYLYDRFQKYSNGYAM